MTIIHPPISHSIKVYKQYFNFASAHFLIFEDGSREPLHGHNYRLECQAKMDFLQADLVFDFLDIKPIIRDLCNEIDHRLLLPKENPFLRAFQEGEETHLYIQGKREFLIPTKDILYLPIPNISAERLAMYFTQKIDEKTQEKFGLRFQYLEVTIEETPGQSASFSRFL